MAPAWRKGPRPQSLIDLERREDEEAERAFDARAWRSRATIMTTTNGCRPPSAASISLMSENTMSLIHHDHIERLAVDALKALRQKRAHPQEKANPADRCIDRAASASPTRC